MGTLVVYRSIETPRYKQSMLASRFDIVLQYPLRFVTSLHEEPRPSFIVYGKPTAKFLDQRFFQ